MVRLFFKKIKIKVKNPLGYFISFNFKLRRALAWFLCPKNHENTVFFFYEIYVRRLNIGQ